MTSELLPDAPGYVHGIVRTEDDCPAIQCDGCGRLDTHKSLNIVKRRAAVDPLVSLVISSDIRFWGRARNNQVDRLCPDCAKARGFEVDN